MPTTHNSCEKKIVISKFTQALGGTKDRVHSFSHNLCTNHMSMILLLLS